MAAGNPLSGPLPRSFMNLTVLTELEFESTAICEPPDIEFQTWLASVAPSSHRTRIACSEVWDTSMARSSMRVAGAATGLGQCVDWR